MVSLIRVQGLFVPSQTLTLSSGSPDDVVAECLSKNARFEKNINANFTEELTKMFKYGVSLYMGNGRLAPTGVAEIVAMKHTGGHGPLSIDEHFIVIPPLTDCKDNRMMAMGRQIYPYETVPYTSFLKDFRQFMTTQHILFTYLQENRTGYTGVSPNYANLLPDTYEVIKMEMKMNYLWTRLTNAVASCVPAERLSHKDQYVAAQTIIIENWWKDLMPNTGQSSCVVDLEFNLHSVFQGLANWMEQFLMTTDSIHLLTMLTGKQPDHGPHIAGIEDLKIMKKFAITLTALCESARNAKLSAKGSIASATTPEIRCGQTMNVTLNGDQR